MFAGIVQAVIICLFLTNIVDSNLEGIRDENLLYTLPEFGQYIGRVKRAGEKGTTVRIKVMTTGPQNGRTTYADPTLSSLAKQVGNNNIPCPRFHGGERKFLFTSDVPPAEQDKIIREVQKGACTTLGVWDVTLDANRDQLSSKQIADLEGKIKTMESFVEQLGAGVNAGMDYILKMIQEQGGDIVKAKAAAQAEASKYTDKAQQDVNRFNALLRTLEASITENFRRQMEQVRQELRAREDELVVVRAEKVVLQDQVEKYSEEAKAARISQREIKATKATLEAMLAKKDKEAKDLEKKLDEEYKAHTAKMAELDAETERKRTEVAETFKKLAAAQSELDRTKEKIQILTFGEEERKQKYKDAQQYWRDRENADIKLLNEAKEKLSKEVNSAKDKLTELQAELAIKLNEIRKNGEDNRQLKRDLQLNSAKLNEANDKVKILMEERHGLVEQLAKAKGDLVRLESDLTLSQKNEINLQERLKKAAEEFAAEQNRAEVYEKLIEKQTAQLEKEQKAKNANAELIKRLETSLEETKTEYALQAQSVQEMRDQAAGYEAELLKVREQLQEEQKAHLKTKQWAALQDARNKRLQIVNANYARLRDIIAYTEVGEMRRNEKNKLMSEIENMFKQTPELYQKLREVPELKRDMDDKWLQLISSPGQSFGNGLVKIASKFLNEPVDTVAKKGRQFSAFIDDVAKRDGNTRRRGDPDPYGYWLDIIPPKAPHYYNPRF